MGLWLLKGRSILFMMETLVGDWSSSQAIDLRDLSIFQVIPISLKMLQLRAILRLSWLLAATEVLPYITISCATSGRRATLKKRKASFFRKLNEITTLCGVIACAVIYNTSDTKVDVWPSHRKHFMYSKNSRIYLKKGKVSSWWIKNPFLRTQYIQAEQTIGKSEI